jgi:hypothetical protein
MGANAKKLTASKSIAHAGMRTKNAAKGASAKTALTTIKPITNRQISSKQYS